MVEVSLTLPADIKLTLPPLPPACPRTSIAPACSSALAELVTLMEPATPLSVAPTAAPVLAVRVPVVTVPEAALLATAMVPGLPPAAVVPPPAPPLACSAPVISVPLLPTVIAPPLPPANPAPVPPAPPVAVIAAVVTVDAPVTDTLPAFPPPCPAAPAPPLVVMD